MYMFKDKKYYLILGERGAAPTKNHLHLSKPIAFLTFSKITFLAVEKPNDTFYPLSSASVPSTPILLAQVPNFYLR